jgi:epoxide hydrolase 4
MSSAIDELVSPLISINHFIETNGLRLHYAKAGSPEKPLMLLLHGFPEFWGAWKDLMPLLADEYFLIAPDLRGINLSDKPDSVRSYAAKHLVADIVGLIEKLTSELTGHDCKEPARKHSKDKVILVAHDWGGAVAWNVAAQFGHLLSHLVILNSPHPYTFWRDLKSDPHQQAASAYMNWLRKPGCEGPLSENNFARLKEFFLHMSTNNFWFTDSTRALYETAWGQPGALTGGCNYYRASPLFAPHEGELGAAGLELNPEAFRVKVPTLVLWGEADIALPAKLLDGIEPYIDDLTIQRFPQNSHWIAHENPQAVAAAMRDWLV